MTIGSMSRRTGVPVRTVREYEDLGLIYTVGRSAGNYRSFDDEALWCVGIIGGLRGLGLTLTEIHELASTYLDPAAGEPVGRRLAGVLDEVRTRTNNRIAELHGLFGRIDEFEASNDAELTDRADFRARDPHFQKRG